MATVGCCRDGGGGGSRLGIENKRRRGRRRENRDWGSISKLTLTKF